MVIQNFLFDAVDPAVEAAHDADMAAFDQASKNTDDPSFLKSCARSDDNGIDTRDRLVMVGTGTVRLGWAFLKRIDVCSNKPVTTQHRMKALWLTWQMAETLRFNLTARGFRVKVVGL